MNETSTDLSAERRASLAYKGMLLYRKFCGTGGKGICAESFAEYQLKIGNVDVVTDFLGFLQGRLDALAFDDPDDRRAMTQDLIDRISGRLDRDRA